MSIGYTELLMIAVGGGLPLLAIFLFGYLAARRAGRNKPKSKL